MTLTFLKKNITSFVLLLFFFPSKSFGQPYTFSGNIQAQTETKSHMSFFNYVFDGSYMLITNEFAKDSDIKISPAYIQYPYARRKIHVYGPTVGFTVNANGISSDFLSPAKVVSIGAIVLDNIFKDAFEARSKKGQPFKMLSKSEVDSIVKSEKKFDLATLQVRIIKNKKLVRDWKNVSQLQTPTQTTGFARRNFVVYNDQLEINDQVEITFRNKKDTSLIQFEIERMDSPLFPFLATFQRDTTPVSYINFVKNVLEKK